MQRSGVVARLFTFVSTVIERMVSLGAVTAALVSAAGGGVSPEYPVLNSMSTMARFPWVWTCVRAVAGDAAGLPLVAVRKLGGRRQLVDDPLLRLLDRPSTGVTGHLLRKQLLVDFLLTGNAYVWRASPVELHRLHPSNVKPLPIGKGLARAIGGYEVWDGEKHVTLGAAEVLHIRDVSWAAGVAELIGESAIRCLHDDLMMELGAKKLAASQANKGRPDILFSSDGNLGEIGAKEVEGRWERATKSLAGAFVVGRGLKATLLGWSPKEFEFAARSEVVRDVILAVFEVPPARAGLSSANYGTQKQQMRTYWESVVRRVAAFDQAFSLWAAPGVSIETDFTSVEALQVSYTERQQRVLTWTALGATPAAAAEYEGFDEAPVGDVAPGALAPGNGPSKKPEEPQGDKALGLIPALTAYLIEARARYTELADAAEAGADTSLLVRWETERLFSVLDRCVAEHDVARWWAEDLVGSTVEAVRMARAEARALDLDLDDLELEAFAPTRAIRIAERIRARAREAA